MFLLNWTPETQDPGLLQARGGGRRAAASVPHHVPRRRALPGGHRANAVGHAAGLRSGRQP